MHVCISVLWKWFVLNSKDIQANLQDAYQIETLQKTCGCSTYMCLHECALDGHYVINVQHQCTDLCFLLFWKERAMEEKQNSLSLGDAGFHNCKLIWAPNASL